MPPEQFAGAGGDPRGDQFSFCIALWEALSGERPYRGPTIDDLKKQVAGGPQALDASKIPRRLRPILRRGLDPDQRKRFGSMETNGAEPVPAATITRMRGSSTPTVSLTVNTPAATARMYMRSPFLSFQSRCVSGFSDSGLATQRM